MISVDEFLETSRLGQLVEGRTTHEVRDLLGEPEGVSGRGWPQLWKYGSIQLGFHRTTRDEIPFLTSIALYFRVPDEAPPEALKFSGWYPAIGCSYDEFRAHLDEVGIRVYGGVASGPRKHLIVGPGVRITFDEDVLDSIQHTAKREPDRKQLLISVPREALDSIRLEARARGISPSSLCSNWVEERVEALVRSSRPTAQ
jgi:hypothetical protein